jgi:long-chain acyl-CoA synthetase
VLVSVPKILEVLREYVLRVAPEAAGDPGKIHWVRKWWKYRRIHRLFGFKFWAMVVGARHSIRNSRRSGAGSDFLSYRVTA